MKKIALYLDFLRNVRNLSERTTETYSYILCLFHEWLKKSQSVADWEAVSMETLEQYIVHLRSSGMKAKSVNMYITVIRLFFEYLMRFHGLSENPAIYIARMKEPSRLPKFIEDKTIRKVLDNLCDHSFKVRRDRVAIAVAYFTGLRAAELVSLTWLDIYMDDGYLRIVGKGNKERIVPICADLKKILQEWRNYENVAFCHAVPNHVLIKSSGAPINTRLLQEIVARCLMDFCAPDVCHPHALRHSFATNLMRKGVAIEVIQKLLGHASINTTMVYLTISSDYLINEFNKGFAL